MPDEPLPALDGALEALNNQAMIPGEVVQPIAENAIGIQYVHPPDPFHRVYVPEPLSPLLFHSLTRKRHDFTLLEIEKFREHTKLLTGREGVMRRTGDTEAHFVQPPRRLHLDGEASSAPMFDAGAAQVNGLAAAAAPGDGPGAVPANLAAIPFDDDSDSDDADYHANGVANSSSEDEEEDGGSDLDGSVASVEARQARHIREGIVIVSPLFVISDAFLP